jgi:internalin A
VLNPRWVTEGIYTILRAGQKGNCNGALAKSDLITMLDSKHYPQDTHDFLLRLMEKFQLCFKLPLHLNYFDCWLVPELLNETQPEIKALLEAPGLDFRYQFEVLPEGFLPRFIVQTHLYSEANPLWRWRTVLWFNRNGHHDKINYH